MKFPIWTKPAVWGGLGGIVATIAVGFTSMGWQTASTANRLAGDRAQAAVIDALVPFCMAKARADADPAHLAKFKAEQSSYSRSDIVRSSGWATMPGMNSPDGALASACSERLVSAAAG